MISPSEDRTLKASAEQDFRDMRMLTASFVLLLLAASSGTTVAQEGDVRGVHDPCIAREGDTYYVFSTHGGIQVRESKDLKHWERAGEVFDELPAWTGEAVPGVRGLWAPDICHVDSEWRLYYSVSTFGKNLLRLGWRRTRPSIVRVLTTAGRIVVLS